MSASPERDQGVKDDVKPQSEHVSLRIQGTGFPELLIKVKKTTKLSKMMNAYCERAGKALTEIRFLFDGHKLSGSQTVADLDIDEDDDEIVIDVVSEAVGGSN
ncbi:SUMO protein smt3 [Microbotryomycetes sp. JL221]|nr:SUMO protein smt3 [Microbotryomycetes sp. JL221]